MNFLRFVHICARPIIYYHFLCLPCFSCETNVGKTEAFICCKESAGVSHTWYNALSYYSYQIFEIWRHITNFYSHLFQILIKLPFFVGASCLIFSAGFVADLTIYSISVWLWSVVVTDTCWWFLKTFHWTFNIRLDCMTGYNNIFWQCFACFYGIMYKDVKTLTMR